jgi:NMD protein affecting ribosome stability and mRNA decay
VVERHDGVTVEVLRCRRCGRRTIQWMRPEIAALQDAMIEAAEKEAEHGTTGKA